MVKQTRHVLKISADVPLEVKPELTASRVVKVSGRLVHPKIAPEVRQLGVKAIFLGVTGLQNRASDPEFDMLTAECQREIRDRLTWDMLEADPVLLGFRQLHDAVGAPNRKNVASPQALLQLLLKRGALPRINLLVDLYNLVSIETHLSLGAHDLAKVAGHITLRLTKGTERFCPLGQTTPELVRASEYAYVDDANEVLCRLEVRQAEKSKVTLETTACLLIIQGNAATDDTLLSKAEARLKELIARFCSGEAHRLPQS